MFFSLGFGGRVAVSLFVYVILSMAWSITTLFCLRRTDNAFIKYSSRFAMGALIGTFTGLMATKGSPAVASVIIDVASGLLGAFLGLVVLRFKQKQMMIINLIVMVYAWLESESGLWPGISTHKITTYIGYVCVIGISLVVALSLYRKCDYMVLNILAAFSVGTALAFLIKAKYIGLFVGIVLAVTALCVKVCILNSIKKKNTYAIMNMYRQY